MRHRLTVAVAANVCALLIAGSALAEGSWTSYMQDVLTGFESRRWTDKNTDSVATVVKFTKCKWGGSGTAVNNVTIQMRKDNNNWPDDNKGDRTLYCSTSGSGNWGDMASGKYFFKLRKINGSETTFQPLDVEQVKVTY